MKGKKLFTPQILVYCEGSTDKAFVNSIKCAYGNDQRFSLQFSSGGTPEEVLKKCKKINGYAQKYCVVDAKPKITTELRKEATDAGITIVEIAPYLECVELNFLEDTDKYLKGTDKNTAKKRIRAYVVEQGADELEDILKEVITITTLKTKRARLGNYTIIVDLFAKFKKADLQKQLFK